jgi:hypothetical protein
MHASSLPLYDVVCKALAEPDFMPDGGVLGIYCTHSYAHSTQAGGGALPAVLKGADMAVYAVFRALGLSVRVRPVMTREDWGWAWASAEEEGAEGNTRVGRRLGEIMVSGMCTDRSELAEICAEWEHDMVRVHWLTARAPSEFQEPALIHLTVSGWPPRYPLLRAYVTDGWQYGNEADLNIMYTQAALLVDVSPASRRNEVAGSDIDGGQAQSRQDAATDPAIGEPRQRRYLGGSTYIPS